MQCQICKKAGMSGNNISHSNRHTKTRFKANVHKQTISLERQGAAGQDLQPLSPHSAQAAPGEGQVGHRLGKVGKTYKE